MFLKARVFSYPSKWNERFYLVLLGTKFEKEKLKAIMWHTDFPVRNKESKESKTDAGFLGKQGWSYYGLPTWSRLYIITYI